MSKTNEKTNKFQFETLVQYMENDENFANGKLNSVNTIREKWEHLTSILNELGPPIKNRGSWQRVWHDYKYHIKKKLRNETRVNNLHPGKIKFQYSDLECRVITLIDAKSNPIGIRKTTNFSNLQVNYSNSNHINAVNHSNRNNIIEFRNPFLNFSNNVLPVPEKRQRIEVNSNETNELTTIKIENESNDQLYTIPDEEEEMHPPLPPSIAKTDQSRNNFPNSEENSIYSNSINQNEDNMIQMNGIPHEIENVELEDENHEHETNVQEKKPQNTSFWKDHFNFMKDYYNRKMFLMERNYELEERKLAIEERKLLLEERKMNLIEHRGRMSGGFSGNNYNQYM